MQRWDSSAVVPATAGPSVVTLGNFDGMHAGHREVLRQVVAAAHERRLKAVAVTFDPHPLQVLFPERAPAVLTGLAHKLDLMAATGLDGVLVMTFTPELARWSPEEFVQRVLVGQLQARHVVVGRDVRFGHRNSGDLTTLQQLGQRHGFTVAALGDVTGGGDGEAPGERRSSTQVRELLARGEVEPAAEILGRPHRVSGDVVHGDHRGRELGYPTANLAPTPVEMVPADGVYAGWLIRTELPGDGTALDRVLPAAISVGTNPTFDGVERRVEAYVLDRDDLDLYDEHVAVEFVARLRPTVRFDSVADLVVQMREDVEHCRQRLTVLVPPAPGDPDRHPE